MIQPKYLVFIGKLKKNKFYLKKMLYIGLYHIGWNPYLYPDSKSIYKNVSLSRSANFEYYYDVQKDAYYLISNIGFYAFDDYVKRKMGIPPIVKTPNHD